ncbi:MAG: AAA family ATPase [Candidatus Heimdallarchaeaceae archaeon]
MHKEEKDKFKIKIASDDKLIHLFGPPASGKTSFAIQLAFTLVPESSFYFITSHNKATLRRMNQMAKSKRWESKRDIFQKLFPINVASIEALIEKLKLIANVEEVGSIIIDYITDFDRGALYKEEKKEKIRQILELLSHIAEEKNCKVLIVNGWAFKGKAPAYDLIESFCDLSLIMSINGQKKAMIIAEETFEIIIDDGGLANIELEIY